MKLAISFFLLLGALPLVVYPFVLLANVMGLAGHRSGNEPLILVVISYAFYIGTTAYPIVYLVCVVFAIAGAIRRSRTALRWAFAPLGYLVLLVALVGVWSVAERSASVLQEQGITSHIAKCTAPVPLDGGDGLSTTGCGILTIGAGGTGATSKTSEAHNWEFSVESASRHMITIKNDKTSCPDIKILDLSGRIAKGFEQKNVPLLCPAGTMSTSFHYFTPPGKGTYFLRVFTPKTPGTYSLKIDQK